MLCFLRYAPLRSLYPLLSLAALWGGTWWGPWLSLPLMPLCLHAVTYVESWFGESPPDLVTSRVKARFLSHPEDAHVLLYGLLHYAGIASAFWLWCHPALVGLEAARAKLGFGLGAGLWLGWSGGINMGINFHSHAHCPLFRNKALNRWFGRLCTMPGFVPSYWWWYKHLVVHHRKLGEPEDWVQPRRKPNGDYENIWRYMLLHFPWRWASDFVREFRRSSASIRRRAAREFSIMVALWVIPFFIDPWMALGTWVLPAWFGGALIMGSGMYAQHAGGTNDTRYGHSTTFLAHFFNLTMFNAGFHIEHTACPRVHWSELPALHRRLRAEIIAGGGHVVPFGIYGGASRLTSILSPSRGWKRFMVQHPGYVPRSEKPRDGAAV